MKQWQQIIIACEHELSIAVTECEKFQKALVAAPKGRAYLQGIVFHKR